MAWSPWRRLGRLLACRGISPDTELGLQGRGGLKPPSHPQSFDAADRKPTMETPSEEEACLEVIQLPPSCLSPPAPEAPPVMLPATLPTPEETVVRQEREQGGLGEGTTGSFSDSMPAVRVTMQEPSLPPTPPSSAPSSPLPPLPQLHLSLPGGLPQRHHHESGGRGSSSEDETDNDDDDGSDDGGRSSSEDKTEDVAANEGASMEVVRGFHVKLLYTAADDLPQITVTPADEASVPDKSWRSTISRGQLRQLLPPTEEDSTPTPSGEPGQHQQLIRPAVVSSPVMSAEQRERSRPAVTTPSVMSAEELIRSARCASDAVSASLSSHSYATPARLLCSLPDAMDSYCSEAAFRELGPVDELQRSSADPQQQLRRFSADLQPPRGGSCGIYTCLVAKRMSSHRPGSSSIHSRGSAAASPTMEASRSPPSVEAAGLLAPHTSFRNVPPSATAVAASKAVAVPTILPPSPAVSPLASTPGCVLASPPDRLLLQFSSGSKMDLRRGSFGSTGGGTTPTDRPLPHPHSHHRPPLVSPSTSRRATTEAAAATADAAAVAAVAAVAAARAGVPAIVTLGWPGEQQLHQETTRQALMLPTSLSFPLSKAAPAPSTSAAAAASDAVAPALAAPAAAAPVGAATALQQDTTPRDPLLPFPAVAGSPPPGPATVAAALLKLPPPYKGPRAAAPQPRPSAPAAPQPPPTAPSAIPLRAPLPCGGAEFPGPIRRAASSQPLPTSLTMRLHDLLTIATASSSGVRTYGTHRSSSGGFGDTGCSGGGGAGDGGTCGQCCWPNSPDAHRGGGDPPDSDSDAAMQLSGHQQLWGALDAVPPAAESHQICTEDLNIQIPEAEAAKEAYLTDPLRLLSSAPRHQIHTADLPPSVQEGAPAAEAEAPPRRHIRTSDPHRIRTSHPHRHVQKLQRSEHGLPPSPVYVPAASHAFYDVTPSETQGSRQPPPASSVLPPPSPPLQLQLLLQSAPELRSSPWPRVDEGSGAAGSTDRAAGSTGGAPGGTGDASQRSSLSEPLVPIGGGDGGGGGGGGGGGSAGSHRSPIAPSKPTVPSRRSTGSQPAREGVASLRDTVSSTTLAAVPPSQQYAYLRPQGGARLVAADSSCHGSRGGVADGSHHGSRVAVTDDSRHDGRDPLALSMADGSGGGSGGHLHGLPTGSALQPQRLQPASLASESGHWGADGSGGTGGGVHARCSSAQAASRASGPHSGFLEVAPASCQPHARRGGALPGADGHLDLDPDHADVTRLHKPPRCHPEPTLPLPHRPPHRPASFRVSPLGLDDGDRGATVNGAPPLAAAAARSLAAASAASVTEPPSRLSTVFSGSEHGSSFGGDTPLQRLAVSSTAHPASAAGSASRSGLGVDPPLQRLAFASAAHQAAAALGLPPPGRRLTRTASEASAAYRLMLEGHSHGPTAAVAATVVVGVTGGSGGGAPSGRSSLAGGTLSTLSSSGLASAAGGAGRSHLLVPSSGVAAGAGGSGGCSAGVGEEDDEREEERSLRDATLAYLRQLSDASNSFSTRHGERVGGQQQHHYGGGSGGSAGHSSNVSPSTTSIVPPGCTAPDSPVKTYHRSILGGDSNPGHHRHSEVERGGAGHGAAAAHLHQVPHHYPSAGSIAARAAAAASIAAAGRSSLDTGRTAAASTAAAMRLHGGGGCEVDSGVFGAAACTRGQLTRSLDLQRGGTLIGDEGGVARHILPA